MSINRPLRIFWLGMHKVLTTTELPLLRKLGYEVFNPPYLADIYDQSANVDWDKTQPTTLPPEVFHKLSTYSFFYNQIEPEIAELLNAYFDAVIVTINPQWLAAVVRVYRRKIIYRTYGQTYQLSAHFVSDKIWPDLLGNRDFYMVPFAEETMVAEHRWLLDRCYPVPYTLPGDVYGYENTWQQLDHTDEIMVSVPNLDHSYYNATYKHLNVHFPGSYLRMYGVQPRPVADRRVVGTIPRDRMLRAYQRAAGYFYPYHDSGVCYLPPIEMMTIGGPVVYVSGSLLHRFFKGNDAGLVYSLDDQRHALDRLRFRDRVYISEIIAAQGEVYRRYHPDYVTPMFEVTFKRLLGEGARQPTCAVRDQVIEVAGLKPPTSEIWLLCHWPGQLIYENPATGAMFAQDGISRVITKVAASLARYVESRLVLSCFAHQASIILSFFRDDFNAGRMALYVLDQENLSAEQADPASDASVVRFLIERQFPAGSVEEQRWQGEAIRIAGRLRLAALINRRQHIRAVFVPHYYHFPEALQIDRNLVFYVPDYMPHFFPDVPFEGTRERDAGNARMGRLLAERASKVLVNSEFTRSYLSDCVLSVDPGKIRVTPMPLLAGELPAISLNDRRALDALIPRSFLFYPTANRPNKELAFLVEVFHDLREKHRDLKLVLTCNLGDHPPVLATVNQLGLHHEGPAETRDIFLFPGTDEGTLRYLYERAKALAFTSTMEGNFPPQIIEALHYNTPVVATRLPHIVEVAREDADALVLCEPKNERDFFVQLNRVLLHPQLFQERQLQAKRRILDWNHFERFSRMVSNIFLEVLGMPRLDSEVQLQPFDEAALPFGLLARVKRCLAPYLNGHQFVHAVFDFLCRAVPQPEVTRTIVQRLQHGTSRGAIIGEIVSGAHGFGWPDPQEREFVMRWLQREGLLSESDPLIRWDDFQSAIPNSH